MVSEGRQRIIEANRSLRLIKNELEALLEKGILTDDAFDNISRLLPTESSISAAAATPGERSTVASPAPTSPPTTGLNNMSIATAAAAAANQGPPSYSQSTGNNNNSTGAAAPPLPGRNAPAPPAPTKPVLAYARAVYRYAATDARDCSFERHDRIAIYEYMNADWWMGCNQRTDQEGIFPKNYVEVEPNSNAPQPGQSMYPQHNQAGYMPMGEKAGYQGPAQPQYGGYPPPPGQTNAYNSHAPPMAMAEQSQPPPQQQQAEGGENKIAEGGKKFGKKLGNAAIFGAGATIGSNLVNSIF